LSLLRDYRRGILGTNYVSKDFGGEKSPRLHEGGRGSAFAGPGRSNTVETVRTTACGERISLETGSFFYRDNAPPRG